MTIFAGVFATAPDAEITAYDKQLLHDNISRKRDSQQEHVFESERCFAVGIDIDAYSTPSHLNGLNGGFASLMGDAFLRDGENYLSRERQLEHFDAACNREDHTLFANCRGTFAFGHHEPSRHSLTLVTDKMGIRPIYYGQGEGVLFFASCLRVLAAIDRIDRRISLRGLCEQASFGYPLSNRTPFANIFVLRECELLSASFDGVSVGRYYNWDFSMEPTAPYRERLHNLDEAFGEAIRLRSNDDTSAISGLSGGLDSRAIVATLVDRGIKVEALNFSPDRSQDRGFAKLYAAANEDLVSLHCFPRQIAGDSPWPAMARRAIDSLPAVSVTRKGFVWSGDGGSVGLGRVHMDDTLQSRSVPPTEIEIATSALKCQGFSFPLSVLRSPRRGQLGDWPVDTVVAELARYAGFEDSVRVFAYLMFNEQRRHLFGHFEDIDLHEIEFHLPFYDSEFVRRSFAFTADEANCHRLYSDWFDLFPEQARSTPWQTYAGHVPCPIRIDHNLTYQWDDDMRKRSTTYKRERRRRSLRLLVDTFHSDFPKDLLSVGRLRGAALVSVLGIRDYSYLANIADAFNKYAQRPVGQKRAP